LPPSVAITPSSTIRLRIILTLEIFTPKTSINPSLLADFFVVKYSITADFCASYFFDVFYRHFLSPLFYRHFFISIITKHQQVKL
jgi:hypothetical protein